MEELDLEGMFWLSDNPSKKIAGRLTFNDTDGSELRLIGSFHDPDQVLTSHSGPVVSVPIGKLYGPDVDLPRIFGETTHGFVTLDNCWRKLGSFGLPGIRRPAREHYGVRAVFLGLHFDEDSPLAFSGVSTRIHDLEHWTRLSLVRINLDYSEELNGLKEVRIVAGQPKKLAAESTLGKVYLSLGYSLKGDHIVESAITQRQTIQLRFSEPKLISDILRICLSLRDLVTIGTNTPVSINSISLAHGQSERPVDFYTRLIGSGEQGGYRFSDPSECLFSFEDIGRLGGLAKWLDVAQKYQLVIDRLLSPEYRPPLYVEHKFFDCFTAAEALVRIKKQSTKSLNMSKELKELGGLAGGSFDALVGDVDCWVKRVVRSRVNDVFHRGTQRTKALPLDVMSESLYFLTLLVLLRECAAPDSVFDRIRNHSRFLRCSENWRKLCQIN